MDTLSLIASRRSVRAFTDQPVTREAALRLIEAARWAPSAGNRQPWHFYAVTNPEVRRRLCDEAFGGQRWMLEAQLTLVIAALPEKSAGRYFERGAELYCLQDTAAAIENILLCAHADGLGACWMGAFSEEACARVLGMEQGARPIAVLSVGYPREAPAPRPRESLEEIMTWVE